MKILLTIAAIFAIVSCSESQNGQDNTEFSIYGSGGERLTSLTIGSNGSTETIRLYSSHAWTAESDSWITIDPKSGPKGSGQIKVTLGKNEGSEQRKGNIRFTINSATQATLPVTQSGTVAGEEETGLKANLLDVEFQENGTAADLSSMKNVVSSVSGTGLVAYPNKMYERVAAHFGHTAGGTASDGYYRIDYKNNTAMKKALCNGHTLEVLFKADKESTGEKEIKMFSSHQSGGTGFLISKTANGKQLTFLPNVSTTGSSKWIWTGSGINPEAGRYYHAVGVWDKENGKSYIYVDGELKGSADAVGELILPKETAQAFCIGGDPASSGSLEAAWNGDVVLARIYGSALSAKDVETLWNKVRREQTPEVVDISNLSFLSGCSVSEGYKYYIYGNGFKDGDAVTLQTMDGKGSNYTCKTVKGNGYLEITIPSGMKSGSFRMMLTRGTTEYPLGKTELKINSKPEPVKMPKVVAHRGTHSNTAGPYENSLESFIKSQELGVWGSEFDVWITTDSVVVVNHNSKVMSDSHVIQNSTYAEIKDLKLGVGEHLPVLEEYLDQALLEDKLTLVLEVKTHSTKEKNYACIEKCVEQLKAKKLEDRTVWIAFSYDNCLKILSLLPNARVQYLNGDRSPASLASTGIIGIDYSYSVLANNLSWIKEAHDNNMVVNVWTVNSEEEMMKYIGLGVDYITTNNPALCMELCNRKWIAEP